MNSLGQVTSTKSLAFRRCANVLLATVLSCAAVFAADYRTLSRTALRDKIRGGWAGQMIGVAYGAATEFKAKGRIGDWELPWKMGMLENAITQDDLYVEMTFARVMDEVGLGATAEQYGQAFRNSQYSLWHANAGARRALNQGVKASLSGHPKYNFHANDIDFQIEADFIGLMCPGLPRQSNELCQRVGRVMNYGDGLYGGMFVCGMYAAAYFENEPERVVAAGLRCIPAGSQYASLIRDILGWHRDFPQDWRHVWQLLETKWDKDDVCPAGALDSFNIDAKLNGGYIVMGLLFGDKDFEKTMEVSTRCGQDSDCNPSSAAGVLGVMLGYESIPARFKEDLISLENRKFSYTDYSFNDIVGSTERRALAAVGRTGGTVGASDIKIKVQKPKAPPLEQWSPGVPDRKIKASDPAFSYSQGWSSPANGERVSQSSSNEVTVTFTGRAIAILGELGQDGGRARVFIDGKAGVVADAYVTERTYEDVLWNVYDLRPGPHRVRLVTLESSDARSKGKRLSIRGAVIYR